MKTGKPAGDQFVPVSSSMRRANLLATRSYILHLYAGRMLNTRRHGPGCTVNHDTEALLDEWPHGKQLGGRHEIRLGDEDTCKAAGMGERTQNLAKHVKLARQGLVLGIPRGFELMHECVTMLQHFQHGTKLPCPNDQTLRLEGLAPAFLAGTQVLQGREELAERCLWHQQGFGHFAHRMCSFVQLLDSECPCACIRVWDESQTLL